MSERRKDQIGARVRFLNYVDRFPFAQIEPGETGTVAVVEKGFIAVTMDKHHEGLDEWENALHFSADMETFDEFFAASFLEAPPAAMRTLTKETTYAAILEALQNAEEMGGVHDYADYAALMVAVMRECRTRLRNMVENRPACECERKDEAERPCEGCKAKQIVEEAGLL